MTQRRRPHLSDQALADINEIWLYIAQDSLQAADRVVNRIYEATLKLAEQPGMGHRHQDIGDDELRVWSVYDYLIIYRLNSSPLEIVRVISGVRDIGRLLE